MTCHLGCIQFTLYCKVPYGLLLEKIFYVIYIKIPVAHFLRCILVVQIIMKFNKLFWQWNLKIPLAMMKYH
jgi:hypothetical protein